MRELYEGYIGVLSVDHGPNFKYEPEPAKPGYTLYRKGQLPTGNPGGSSYEQGLTRPGITDVNADEEGQSIAKAIILEKVDELIEQSVMKTKQGVEVMIALSTQTHTY